MAVPPSTNHPSINPVDQLLAKYLPMESISLQMEEGTKRVTLGMRTNEAATLCLTLANALQIRGGQIERKERTVEIIVPDQPRENQAKFSILVGGALSPLIASLNKPNIPAEKDRFVPIESCTLEFKDEAPHFSLVCYNAKAADFFSKQATLLPLPIKKNDCTIEFSIQKREDEEAALKFLNKYLAPLVPSVQQALQEKSPISYHQEFPVLGISKEGYSDNLSTNDVAQPIVSNERFVSPSDGKPGYIGEIRSMGWIDLSRSLHLSDFARRCAELVPELEELTEELAHLPHSSRKTDRAARPRLARTLEVSSEASPAAGPA